jgi:hypothetical protein
MQNTMLLVEKIEKRYGAYDKEIKVEVGRFLLRRFEDHAETLALVLDAIKEVQPSRFGPPEVADINKAVQEYEATYGVRLRVPVVSEKAPSRTEIVISREDTLAALEKEAEAAGIDTSAEGWVAAYCMQSIADKDG